MAEGSKRLYVGNLHPEISEKELRDRFNKFGKVANVEIKHKTDIDGNPTQTFSFVDIHMSDNDVTGCISTLANTNWKGYSMRIQQAKESFMSRLARERKEKENQGTMQGTPGTPVYNPLSLVKSRLEGDGGEQKRKDELKTDRPTVLVNKPERKRFLGGERDPQEGGRNAPSGNYTRGGYYYFTNKLGRRDFNQEPRSLDPSESRDYLPGRGSGSGSGSGYDPLSMIKRHMGGGQVVPDVASEAPVGPGVRVDEGSVNNGVVTFDEAEEKGPARKRKIYHSSDEEEDGGKVRTEPRKEQVKKKIKKVESAEVKAKKKAELKEKWEAKQKEKMKQDELEAYKQNKKTKKDNSGARYYSSSEEEEEEESNEPEKNDKLDGAAPEKASLSILKKFKSFSSSVWADSDQEEEEEEEDEEEDNMKEEEEDVEEVNAEEERERNYAILSQVVGKNVQEPAQHKPRSLGLDYMPRFDPEASDPEDAAKDAEDTTKDVEETSVEAGAPSVEISKNLKEALGKGSFSFGFRKSEPEQEIKPVKPELFHLDSDDETETVKKVADFSETFGNQLQGKIDENAESFFFIPDDERLKEGIQFFFHEREDLEKVRAEYNAKRPELAAIFKNKARSKAQLDRKNIKSRPKFKRFKSQRGRPNKHH